jgi:perosamine synthetase
MAAEKKLPYGRQSVDEADIEAVVEVLRSDWLTTGPKVEEFEHAFAELVGAPEAVAVSSGTAALHAAAFAADIGPGDEVVVADMTFVASANCVVYQGGTPVFADVDPDTLLLDVDSLRDRITDRTKAIVAVDFGGQPCDYEAIGTVADNHGLTLIADACHALGGSLRGRRVGSLADLNAFSFHPVKHLTTGEGGMVTTADPALAERLRCFRNHGIDRDFRQRDRHGSWAYGMAELGFNYRLTDLQCALGLSQLRRLGAWIERRRELARRYDAALEDIPGVKPLAVRDPDQHAYHLYVVQVQLEPAAEARAAVFEALRSRDIGVNVHYLPVHLHPYYQRRLGTGPGLCPVAEAAYDRLLSLPIFPAMSGADVDRVVAALEEILSQIERGGPVAPGNTAGPG